MAITLQITEGYATVAEADLYLELDTAWLNASDETKADALMWGRYYLEDNFTYDLDNIDVIDEEAKLANSVLAADYIANGKLFGDSEAPIQSKSVKADVVSKTVVYDTSKEYKPPSVGKAFTLMAKVADRISGNTISLLRA